MYPILGSSYLMAQLAGTKSHIPKLITLPAYLSFHYRGTATQTILYVKDIQNTDSLGDLALKYNFAIELCDPHRCYRA